MIKPMKFHPVAAGSPPALELALLTVATEGIPGVGEGTCAGPWSLESCGGLAL